MTRDEIISRLKAARMAERRGVANATGLRLGYLNKLAYGEIKNPGSVQLDALRSHYLALDIMHGRPQ